MNVDTIVSIAFTSGMVIGYCIRWVHDVATKKIWEEHYKTKILKKRCD